MTKQIMLIGGLMWLAAGATAMGIEYQITIDASQEVPPPVLGGATPSGVATVDVNTITGDVTVTGTYTGLTGNATASHIHGLAPAGTAAGVLMALTVDGGTAGNLTGNGQLNGANLAGLLAGETYVNIHTANNGPGEIRGQIVDDDILVYSLMLTADQSVPTPTLGGATPSGQATVVVDKSTGLVEVSGSYAGMTSGVTAAHLHGLAEPGSTAGVLFGFTTSGGTDGTFSGTGTLGLSDLEGLLAGQTYVNVHTTNNGPGEIRAQVVPEPASLTLLLTALLPVATRRRRS